MYSKCIHVLKKYKQIIFFVVLYPKRTEIYAEVRRN